VQNPLHIVNTQGLVVRDGRYLMIMRSDLVAQAPGTLSPPGGKAEFGGDQTGVMETALQREVIEKTGVTIGEMTYIQSIRFALDSGTSVVDAALLCRYESDESHLADLEEVASVEWLTSEQIFVHPRSQPWTESIVKAAEKLRVELGL
jgi:8-oxo-dGTP diphosphatase